ncbi:MAG TPA: hypothetical protein VHD33_00780, partial [Legionellaceae bacterium]|nr:hypothetical protein [Legionellaceae bacterium]
VKSAIRKQIDLTLFPYAARIGCDIRLKPISDQKNLAELRLDQAHPHLIQYRDKYFFYGNTDGTAWGYTPVESQFIPPNVVNKFSELKRQPKESSFILRLHESFAGLYQQMINKKAHTFYRSQFDVKESEIIKDHSSVIQRSLQLLEYIRTAIFKSAPLPTATVMSSGITQSPLSIIDLNPFNTQIENIQLLSADQALDLYLVYQYKMIEYRNITEKKFKIFKKLMEEAFAPDKNIQFEPHSPLYQKCKRLYHELQPYLIGMRNFPDFDQKMIRAFSSGHNSLQGNFDYKKFEEFFRGFYIEKNANRVRAWQDRAKKLYAHAQTALQTEHCQQPLQKIKDVHREDFIFKSTQASTTIHHFIESLKQWIPKLNTSIQRTLVPRDNNVPYPDLSPSTQSPMVLLAQRIFNALYHLEESCKLIENLKITRNSTIQAENRQTLINLYGHLERFWNLALQIYNDPSLIAITNEIKNQYHYFLPQLTTLINPYGTSPDQVDPINSNVQYSGLWYTLNALYITPKHLHALTHQDDNPNFGSEQSAAKEATLQIETIIRHSDSYWQLFLSSIQIYRLITGLKDRLKKFGKTTQEMALDHLEIIQHKYLVPLLLECDIAEKNLIPGTISHPLNRMIDEWYQGLLFPLHLSFSQKETLACNAIQYAISQRITSERHRLQQTRNKLQEIIPKLTILNDFLQKLNAFTETLGFSDYISPAEIPTDLMSLYTLNIVPMLLTDNNACQLKQRIHPVLNRNTLKNIKSQTSFLETYWLGVQATETLYLTSSQEKLLYLQQLETEAEQAIPHYRQRYAKDYFENHLQALAYPETKLKDNDLNQEYHQELRQYLQQQKTTLFANIETQDNIDTYLKNHIDRLSKFFEATYLLRYQQLDATQKAIDEFISAIKKDKKMAGSLKAKKLNCLNHIHNTLHNNHDTGSLNTHLDYRFQMLKKEIKDSETCLLEYHYRSILEWLLDCLVQLLSTVGLSTHRQRCYTNLANALDSTNTSHYWCRFLGQRPPSGAQIAPLAVSHEQSPDYRT